MNPSTALARVLVDELPLGGVGDVVLAPGSRSAPLALALAEAEAEGRLRLHVRLDERSAGYLALGLARCSGRPVAVVTTSGTAAVNLHAAAVEADQSGIPLLLLTADRPPELRGTGANQTIDQVGLFGTAVRASIDLGVPRAEPGQVRAWRSVLARAIAIAVDAVDPGPVQLNLPLAEPLVPTGDEAWPESLDGRPDGRAWTVDGRLQAGLVLPIDAVVSQALGAWSPPARGLIVVGDQADPEVPDLVDELADGLGWPVLCEPSGGCAGAALAVAHGPLLLADPAFAAAYAPDCVLTVGRVGLSRAVLRAIAGTPLHLAVDPRPAIRWADPTRTAAAVLATVPLPPEAATTEDPGWWEGWLAADEAAADALGEVLASAPTDALTGPGVALGVAAALAPGDLLIAGASWPVRHLDAFAGAGLAGVRVLGNRGTAGIDGVVSTAWGAALAHGRDDEGSGRSLALLGDLSFLYDHGGLLAPVAEARPDLVLVVMDNDGGGIFSALEQGAPEHARHFERVFGTPHGRDLAAIATASGVPCVTVDTTAALGTAIEAAMDEGGLSVVVARTASRPSERALLARIQGAVGRALAGLAEPGGPARV